MEHRQANHSGDTEEQECSGIGRRDRNQTELYQNGYGQCNTHECIDWDSIVKRYHSAIIGTTVIVAILSVGYFLHLYVTINTSPGKVEAMKDLTVIRVDHELGLDVDASFWGEIEPEKIKLYPQAARSPYGNVERELWVRLAYNDHEVAFLLEFEDDTEDLGAPVDPDACAILFAEGNAPATAQMMGYGSTANIWQWLADKNTRRYKDGDISIVPVRELIAHGPGTQTPLEKQNVDAKGEYREGKWEVVFKRNLESNQDGELEFRPGSTMTTAFALWNGSRMELFSRKSIAILRILNWEQE